MRSLIRFKSLPKNLLVLIVLETLAFADPAIQEEPVQPFTDHPNFLEIEWDEENQDGGKDGDQGNKTETPNAVDNPILLETQPSTLPIQAVEDQPSKKKEMKPLPSSNQESVQPGFPNDCKPYRITLKHREANGIGYHPGYTSLLAFFANAVSDRTWFFTDLRGHVFNNATWALNAGLGARTLVSSADVIAGLNINYDFRKTKHYHFHQIGLGLEAFPGEWDIHFNSYFPVSKRRYNYRTRFDEFKDNRAIFSKKYEFDFIGADLLIGRNLWSNDLFAVHATLGGYYLAGKFDKHAAGGLLRASANFTQYLNFEIQGSYDSLFHGVVQGQIAIEFPFGKVDSDRSVSCRDRMIGGDFNAALDRFEIIPIDEHRRKAVAIDPDTGLPLNFIFVDNLLGSSNGTIEHPYATLAQAEMNSVPRDVIYVFEGDGTSNGMDAGIVLQDHQWLQGSGDTMSVLTRFGQLAIPAQTANKPLITNAAADSTVVLLANFNTVNGLQIQCASGDISKGIFGDAFTQVAITNNRLFGGTGSNALDLLIEEFFGQIDILNNSFASTFGMFAASQQDFNMLLANNLFNSVAESAEVVSLNSSVSKVRALSNTITSSAGMIIGTASQAASPRAYCELLFKDNLLISPSGTGFVFGVEGGTLVAEIDSNSTRGNVMTNGIHLNTSRDGIGIFEVKNNILEGINPGTNSIFVNAQDSGMTDTSSLHLRMFGNVNQETILLERQLGVLRVQSPNLAASGLGPPVNGTVPVTSGTVTFIPVFPPFE